MFMSHRSLVRTAAIMLLPVAFLAESAVARGVTNEATSVTVRYHDLDLGSERGVASLYARIHAAAEAVCKLSEDSPFAQRTFWTEGYCVSHAVARAVRAVHNDRLSAYHWRQIRLWKREQFDASTTASAR